MPVIDILWDLPEDPDGNIQHIAEHGLVPEDVEYVFHHTTSRSISRSTGQPLIKGFLAGGEKVVVVYEQIDATCVYPITAYVVEA